MLAASLPLLLSLVCVCASKATSSAPDRRLCIDAAVSASGAFPTDPMEDPISASPSWSETMDSPDDLAQVTGDRLFEAYAYH